MSFSNPFSLTVQIPDRSLTALALKENAEIAVSQLVQRSNAPIGIPLTHFKVWNDVSQALPSAATADDLGLVTGTVGTNFPKITAGDVKATSSTRSAGLIINVPSNFDPGQTLTVRVRSGMETNVADTSCDVDVSVYSSDGDGTCSLDLVTTSAQSMNSLTPADRDFLVNTTSLSAGQGLFVVVSVIYVDAATGTAVTPAIYGVTLLADLRG